MTDTLSLGPVLDLIERWQDSLTEVSRYPPGTVGRNEWNEKRRLLTDELLQLPILGLKQLTEQHAAQLRKLALEYGDGDIDAAVGAAADFLAAPRREPEAE